jgi:hypothetical protein
LLFALFTLLGYVPKGLAQSEHPTSSESIMNGKKIDAAFGLGTYAIIDEYVSQHKYSGPITTMKLKWTSTRDSTQSSLGMEFQQSGSISNNSVEADVYNIRLQYNETYCVPTWHLLSDKDRCSLGPSMELMTHIRMQQVADRDFYSKYLSFFLLFSGGAVAEYMLPIGDSFRLTSAAFVEVVSVGIRAVDLTTKSASEQRDPIIRILTPLTNQNIRWVVGCEYDVGSGFTATGQYEFRLLRNTSWDRFVAAGDYVSIRVAYGW